MGSVSFRTMDLEQAGQGRTSKRQTVGIVLLELGSRYSIFLKKNSLYTHLLYVFFCIYDIFQNIKELFSNIFCLFFIMSSTKFLHTFC